MAEIHNIKVVASADIGNLTKGMEGVQSSLAKTAVAAQKTDSALGGIKTGANQATNAMVNLGRVVQDAPFGFIGIANNINPLLESFQRLKAETGSTKAALSALGSSLIGGGGLGIAVSVATSLLTLFALNTRSAGSAAEETTKKTKKYAEVLDEIVSSLSKEATETLSLIAVLNSETETRDRKLSAINELKRIQPEIFSGLKLEKDAVIGLDEAYKAYLLNFKQVIAAKLIQAEIEKKLTEILKIQGATQTKEQELAISKLKKYTDSVQALQNAATPGGNKRTFFQQQEVDAKVLNAEINELIKKLAEVSKGIKVDGLKSSASIKVKVEPVIDPRNYPNTLRNLFKDIEDKKFTSKIVVNVQPELKYDAAGINKAAFALADSINSVIQNVFVDAFSGLGQAIGDALSGVSLSGAFNGIIKSLAGGLKEIGQMIIKANVQLAILKKVGFSNPVVGIAVGVAITALGALLQNSIGRTKAFASGVRSFEGGFATVGERGRENIFLPRGASVQPNNEVKAYGGGGVILQPSVVYDGTQFRIFLNRVDAKIGRVA